jgi:hypothetical protein
MPDANKVREKLSEICRELTDDDGHIDALELALKLHAVIKWAVLADAGPLTAAILYGDKLGDALANELEDELLDGHD